MRPWLQTITSKAMTKPSWTIRRRIIVAILSWGVGLVTYLAVYGRDIDLSQTIANGTLLLMASVIGSYVFGAAWDDKNVMKAAVDSAAVDAGVSPYQVPEQETK